MKSLDAFLNPGGEGNTFFVVSKRFKDSNGAIEWELKTQTTKELQVLSKKYIKDGVLDQQAYENAIISRSVVYPDLTDASLQKSYGVVGELDLLTTMLRPGEYADLKNKVFSINGLVNDINSDIEEAKN